MMHPVSVNRLSVGTRENANVHTFQAASQYLARTYYSKPASKK